MAQMQTRNPLRSGDQPIASHADAQSLVGHLCEVMDSLLGTVEKETALVRAGQLREAGRLEKAKAERASQYLADTERIKANLPYYVENVPKLLDGIRQRHQAFQARLHINLTVLATAHAVSESIIRGVADEVARKSAPQLYGASGRATAPARNAIRPVTLSRTL